MHNCGKHRDKCPQRAPPLYAVPVRHSDNCNLSETDKFMALRHSPSTYIFFQSNLTQVAGIRKYYVDKRLTTDVILVFFSLSISL